jgi:hypothetical protein
MLCMHGAVVEINDEPTGIHPHCYEWYLKKMEEEEIRYNEERWAEYYAMIGPV